MQVFISIVSHNHNLLLNELNSLAHLATQYIVIVKSNILQIEMLSASNVIYLDYGYHLGFGAPVNTKIKASTRNKLLSLNNSGGVNNNSAKVIKITIPPTNGISPSCCFRPLGLSTKLNNRATFLKKRVILAHIKM